MFDANDELIKALLAELERDPRVDLHRHPIHVKWEDHILVLEGVVGDIAAKRIARHAAHRQAGDLPVADRLRVAVPAPEGDGHLRDGVLSRLQQEPVFVECGLYSRQDGRLETVREGRNERGDRIEVEVREGTVTLVGQVVSLTHRRLAEVLAWWTAGCERVENRLHVVPSEMENDGELVDAVRMVLEKDPLVHAGQIAVHARHGVVTLEGLVASEEERRLAVLDVWYIPAVQDVVDKILVGR